MEERVARAAQSETVQVERDVVFLSKATPGDDEFALWLAPKLEAAGYKVFTDIRTLEPGDRWRTIITSTLQNHASKMLLCCSNETLAAAGVQEEIEIGLDLAKELKDSRFVIPLRIRPYKKLFGIGGLQYIDFVRGWAEGLEKLLETLKRQKVPHRSDGIATLDAKVIDAATRVVNLHEAVKKVVKLYADKTRRHRENDERSVDLWVLIVPEIIFERCRPNARRTGLPLELGDFEKRKKTRSDLPLLKEVLTEENVFDDAPDFHRQVKAEYLMLSPTQILRETTIAPDEFKNKAGYPLRRTQDAATVAWNLATGLYYKTQPKPPWKLSGIRAGVCYIGLVYKNLPGDASDHACCAAQMFLSEGDGVVFRGANGPWKKGDFDYHLDASAATDLIGKVLETYRELHGSAPKELFIHGQTYFDEVEWSAFEAAAPSTTNVVGVRIRTTSGETKLFRDGDYPVLRGTAMLLDDKSAYLWTNGYVPQLDTYIGPETPNPLFITALRSKAAMPSLPTILSDIMGLTKINYNSCNYNDGLPVTVRFAKMVGEVLTMGSAKGADRQPFKYYI